MPELAQRVVDRLAQQIGALQEQLATLEKELLAWHRSNELSQRLATIPGVGVIAATALAASVSEPEPLPLGPPVRSVARPDAAAELQRRQGEDGTDLQDG